MGRIMNTIFSPKFLFRTSIAKIIRAYNASKPHSLYFFIFETALNRTLAVHAVFKITRCILWTIIYSLLNLLQFFFKIFSCPFCQTFLELLYLAFYTLSFLIDEFYLLIDCAFVQFLFKLLHCLYYLIQFLSLSLNLLLNIFAKIYILVWCLSQVQNHLFHILGKILIVLLLIEKYLVLTMVDIEQFVVFLFGEIQAHNQFFYKLMISQILAANEFTLICLFTLKSHLYKISTILILKLTLHYYYINQATNPFQKNLIQHQTQFQQ